MLAEETVCRLCRTPGSDADPLEVDRILPRVQGGQDVRENLQALHRSCKRSRPRELRTPAPPTPRRQPDDGPMVATLRWLAGPLLPRCERSVSFLFGLVHIRLKLVLDAPRVG